MTKDLVLEGMVEYSEGHQFNRSMDLEIFVFDLGRKYKIHLDDKGLFMKYQKVEIYLDGKIKKEDLLKEKELKPKRIDVVVGGNVIYKHTIVEEKSIS